MRERLLGLLSLHKKLADKHGITTSIEADDLRFIFSYDNTQFLVLPGRGMNDEFCTFIIPMNPEAKKFYLDHVADENWPAFEQELRERLA